MRRILAGVLAPFLAAAPATGQVVTETAFLAALDAGKPLTASRREPVTRAEAAVVGARRLSNPRISFDREAPGESSESTIRLAWTPPIDGRRGLAVRSAETGAAAARERFAFDRLLLRLELRSVYAAWTIASERERLLERYAARVRSLATRAERRAQAGEGSGLDARRLALAAYTADAAAGASRAESHTARARARAYREDLPSEALPERPALPAPPPDLAAEERADVEALRLEQERALVDEQLAGRWFQAPELQGGWQRVSVSDVRAEGWVFGLNWTVPLFAHGQEEKAEARGRADASRARLVVATQRAREELRGALESYSVLRGEAEAATALDETAESATRGAEAAFGAGELDVTGLVSTLDAALTARLAELELYDRALAAHRALERAAGLALNGEGE